MFFFALLPLSHTRNAIPLSNRLSFEFIQSDANVKSAPWGKRFDTLSSF